LSTTSSITSSSSVSIISIIGVMFVAMKVMGWGDVATWSWWWVTVPFWGPAAAVLAFLVVMPVVILSAGVILLGIVGLFVKVFK